MNNNSHNKELLQSFLNYLEYEKRSSKLTVSSYKTDLLHFLHFINEIQVEEIKEYLLKSVEIKGLPGGVVHMRRQFAKTFKGLKDFRETRIQLLTQTDLQKTMQLLNTISQKWG